MSRTKKRDAGVDFIKLIACLIVIALHVDDVIGNNAEVVFYRVILGDGVALFFIMAGFFMFRKPFEKTLLGFFRNILLPAMVIFAGIVWFTPWLNGEITFLHCLTHPFAADWKAVLLALWTQSPGGGPAQHLWYIGSYFKIIITLPILLAFCSPATPRRYRLFTLGVYFVVRMLLDLDVVFHYSVKPADYLTLAAPCMLAVLGYEIYAELDRIKGDLRIRVGSLLIVIATTGLRFYLQYRLEQIDPSCNRFLFWDTGFAMLAGSAFIIFLLSFDYSKHRICSFLAKAGPETYMVYLVHYPIVIYFSRININAKVLAAVRVEALPMSLVQQGLFLGIKTVLVFLISLVFALLVKYLKKLRIVLIGRKNA